ncbi:MAG: 50S ribosomal protein L19 [Chlamydiales bacterium]|nr:50S ribosomal protein L19 [Chlamydiales bacterium]
MSRPAVIEKVEQMQLRKELPEFSIGDTISVHIRIVEGDKERTQVFTGTVIARRGTGLSETFALHRVAYGEGMERVFLLHSPRISKIELVKRGRVRRAKLYYLRGTSGKKAKVRSLLGARTKEAAVSAKEAAREAAASNSAE